MPEQPSVNLEALADLCTPWCIHVVATLRIADHLASGSHGVEKLAAAAGCDQYVLHCVLSHLVGKGVFEEPEPGRFTLNNAARALLDPALHIGLDLDGFGGRLAYAWGTLLRYVRTGAPAYHELFGRPFWEDLDAHPELAAQFEELIGPTGHGLPDPQFEITGRWESIRTVIDVGGGTGAMLAEMLRAHPHLHGTLLDLPRTVGRSTEIFQRSGVLERASAVGQSFFDPLPRAADLYLLRGILNDWPDREAVAILTRCAQAASPTGRVVVLKSISADNTPKRLAIEIVLLASRETPYRL
jgi:2,7-dihydroxy-5-methyl-1-naphthoate 7-O-methyltransferase